jgi:RNA polymerase sigma-54 factor
MTPQLQQAIKLLQLSRIELVEAVREELLENPVLEEVPEEEASESEAREAAEEALAAGEVPAPGEGDSGASEADAEAEVGEVADAGDLAVALDLDAVASESQTEPTTAADEPAEAAEPSNEELLVDANWDDYMESKPQTSAANSSEERAPIVETVSPPQSLSQHLNWQIGFIDFSDQEREIAQLIAGNLGDNGYLQDTVEHIAEECGVDEGTVEKVLLRVHELDPVGVGARSLEECLRVQARVAGVTDRLVLRLIDEHLGLLQRKDYRAIARIEEVEIGEVAAAAEVLSSFEPRPGRQFADQDPIYITPDIFVHQVGGEYHVVLNDDGLPHLKVSKAYRQVLDRAAGEAKETRDYVREKMRSAQWLIKSIHQRQRTIVKVTESIIRFQRQFFDLGTEHLRPLNLRDVADDIEMHESTVSRVTTAKYVQTPHGIFELKFFFNSSIKTGSGDSIASESVKEKIKTIIGAEDGTKPLSDQRIAKLLKESEDIDIARRTVTKYRESLGILSSTRRKQFR